MEGKKQQRYNLKSQFINGKLLNCYNFKNFLVTMKS